jgi:hypothetical protein
MVTGEQLLAMPSEDLKNRLEIIPLGVRKTILREVTLSIFHFTRLYSPAVADCDSDQGGGLRRAPEDKGGGLSQTHLRLPRDACPRCHLHRWPYFLSYDPIVSR